MRSTFVALVVLAAAGHTALGHGPQIQATIDGGRIVTRRIFQDGPYGTVLSPPTSAYVMPLMQNSAGVWLSRPNGTLLPGGILQYPSGPGIAYGYGYDPVTNPAPFPLGSQLVLGFAGGLKAWDGSGFVDAGATELEAFRGSGVNLVVARTSDTAPFADIQFPSVIAPATGIQFTNAEAHGGVSYRMLGDGSSMTSPLADGIYLATLTLGSTDSSVATSEPFYFVLTKNAAPADVQAAAGWLDVDQSRIQFVPEPTAVWLALTSLAIVFGRMRRRR